MTPTLPAETIAHHLAAVPPAGGDWRGRGLGPHPTGAAGPRGRALVRGGRAGGGGCHVSSTEGAARGGRGAPEGGVDAIEVGLVSL